MAVAVAATEEVAEAAAGPGAAMAGAVVDAAGAVAGATISVRCLLEAGKRSLAAEWAHGVVSAGVAATGAAAIGVASTGVAATGTTAIGVATAGVAAIGTTAIGIIIIIIMM
jgi:hypothetical protein